MQFNKEAGKDIHEAKLRVLYVAPPQPPSPVAESAEEGLSPKMQPSVDNGDRHYMSHDVVSIDFFASQGALGCHRCCVSLTLFRSHSSALDRVVSRCVSFSWKSQ